MKQFRGKRMASFTKLKKVRNRQLACGGVGDEELLHSSDLLSLSHGLQMRSRDLEATSIQWDAICYFWSP
jgi:hypothetical protein